MLNGQTVLNLDNLEQLCLNDAYIFSFLSHLFKLQRYNSEDLNTLLLAKKPSNMKKTLCVCVTTF